MSQKSLNQVEMLKNLENYKSEIETILGKIYQRDTIGVVKIDGLNKLVEYILKSGYLDNEFREILSEWCYEVLNSIKYESISMTDYPNIEEKYHILLDKLSTIS